MSKKTGIGPFQLAMITVAFVAGVRSLPAIAQYGFSCLFYYAIAALIFLIPSALVSAELATAIPGRGGVYAWVSEALGGPWDFLAIWLQFLSNVVYFPAFLSFVGATAAYIIMPQLAHNKYFMVIFILAIFWTATLISLYGMQTSSWISTVGVFVGTVIPLIVIVTLATIWIWQGNPTQVSFTVKSFFPHFSKMRIGDFVFLSGLIFSFTGMEASGAHARDVRDVGKNYPRAILIALPFTMAIGLGALAIAAVVPHKQLSLVAGNMQAFEVFFHNFHIAWGVRILAAMITVGALGNLVACIIGPSKGLFGAAFGGEIPPILSKVNKHEMPANMLICQGIVVSIIAMLFLLMPTISSAYWLVIATVSVIYLGMYLLMFLSIMVLRYKKPDLKRPYKLPGGKVGAILLPVLGIISTLVTMVISFFPPAQIPVGNVFIYELSMAGGVVILGGMGLLIYYFRRPEWVVTHEL